MTLPLKRFLEMKNITEILISFLNSVLDFKDDKEIVKVTLANPYQVPKIPELKETILDIKAKNRNGDIFIVETQKKDLGDFAKRSLYYTSKVYVSSLSKGNNYSELKKVYFIGILNFEMFDNKSYISRHLIINQETKTQDLKDFEFYFLELPKFNKELNELETVLDKWIFFLKNANDLTMIPKEFKFKPFDDAFNIAMQTVCTKKELEVYDYISLKEYDDINAIKTAEKKGIKIEKEKKEIVKNSLKLGLDNETISKITGLSLEKVKEIVNGIKD
jgi:predicted transposase/invertase (TIGR01784 family)